MEKHFEFGKNWNNFSKDISDKRISVAENSLKEMLETDSLKGMTFFDIGCGSGLFSLAAVRLGAQKVLSFDYDGQSVLTAKKLKEQYCENADNWTIEQGDVLDLPYLKKAGEFDIVYSWGALHHTGDMWKALDNIIPNVRAGGKLFISIYNDQGRSSRRWKTIKKSYNKLPAGLKQILLYLIFARIWGFNILSDFLKFRPFKTWKAYKENRGMSPWHDVLDWVGGYPFEVAKPEEIFDFYRPKNFILLKLKTCAGGYGTNEFVFLRK